MRIHKSTARKAAAGILFWFGTACAAIGLLALQSCITPEPYPTTRVSQ
jgi:hypothetical protein